MKNVQVIDGAINSVFEIYAVPDEIFFRLFPDGADIAFAEDFRKSDPLWRVFYLNRVEKKRVKGIHGTLHLVEKTEKVGFFPTKREAEVR